MSALDDPVAPSDGTSTTIAGGCHCGRLTFALSTMRDVATIIPRACRCSFCRKHGAAYISDRQGRLILKTTGSPDDVYRFGYGITDFHVCNRCGVLVAATWSDSDREDFGVVNVRAFEGQPVSIALPLDADFDEEDVPQREARRKDNWTPALVLAKPHVVAQA
jgi:hypothetical protein